MNPKTYQEFSPVASTLEKIAPHMTSDNHILWVSVEQQERCEGHIIADEIKRELNTVVGDVVILLEMSAEHIRKVFVKAIEQLNTELDDDTSIYLFHIRDDVFHAIKDIFVAGSLQLSQ